MADSAFLLARDVREKRAIEAKDSDTLWKAAEVLAVRGSGRSKEVLVHYRGWNASWDEWIPLAAKRMRLPLDGYDLATAKAALVHKSTLGLVRGGLRAEFLVDRLIDKRIVRGRTQYRVRWQDYGEEDDTWENEADINDADIDEYERLHTRAPVAAARMPKVSYAKELCAADSDAVRELRIEDAKSVLNDLARDAAAVLRRKRGCVAQVRIYASKPCLPGVFVALHALLLRLKEQLGVTDAKAVTPLVPVTGGARPSDGFSLNSAAILEAVMAGALPDEARIDGALLYREEGGTPIMLLPPLEFTWKAARGEDGACAPMELTVTGHFVSLVEDLDTQGEFLLRTDNEAFTYEPEDRLAYKQAFAIALPRFAERMGAPAVPPEVLAWLSAV